VPSDPVEAALLRVTSSGAALAAEIEHLMLTARELSENPSGWKQSARSARIAARLREVEEREADLGLACLELQCELVRWESRPSG
jgi:hypothetical protein